MTNEQNSIQGIVQSKSFQLLDEDSNVLAELSHSNGRPMLSMLAQDGTVRLKIGITDRDTAGILLYDKEGDVRIEIRAEDDNFAGLTVYDWEGDAAIILSITDDGPFVQVGS